MDTQPLETAKRKFSSDGSDNTGNDNNNNTRTIKKPKDNNNYKHAFNICGMNFVVSRTKATSAEFLHAFVSRMVRANNLEGSIMKISTSMQHKHELEQANSEFVDLVDFVGLHFHSYEDAPAPT